MDFVNYHVSILRASGATSQRAGRLVIGRNDGGDSRNFYVLLSARPAESADDDYPFDGEGVYNFEGSIFGTVAPDDPPSQIDVKFVARLLPRYSRSREVPFFGVVYDNGAYLGSISSPGVGLSDLFQAHPGNQRGPNPRHGPGGASVRAHTTHEPSLSTASPPPAENHDDSQHSGGEGRQESDNGDDGEEEGSGAGDWDAEMDRGDEPQRTTAAEERKEEENAAGAGGDNGSTGADDNGAVRV